MAARGARAAARAHAGDRNMDGASERCGRRAARCGVPRSAADVWLDRRPKYPRRLRWVTGDIDRTRMAKEIVEQQPDVIVVETTVGVEALARESRTIPMIFVNVSDPIGSGFVANLAHPGGNITGFMSNEPTLGGKWPELLKEIAPAVARVGFLFNPDTAPYAEPFLRHAEITGRSLGMDVTASRVRNDSEMERGIAEIASKAGGGLIVLPEATTNTRSDFIIAIAARHRVPAIYAYRYQAIGGGLISYGVD